jgi:ABC-type Na+ efflux pump permease subunit
VIVEFAVIMVIVTNAAASTVTREKEDGSLDLLLSTPITSRYYIWGKLRGLVSFVLPLVAVPVMSVTIFVVYDLIRLMQSSVDFKWIVFPEAILIMPGLLIIVAAFAAILGMNMSLRCRTTVRAVMSSVGIVVGICAGLGWCGYQMLRPTSMGNELVLMFASFSPFTVITVLIDPYTLGGSTFQDPNRIPAARFIILFVSWVATAAYALVVWSMYKTMVKNFDMTIRKQSR